MTSAVGADTFIPQMVYGLIRYMWQPIVSVPSSQREGGQRPQLSTPVPSTQAVFLAASISKRGAGVTSHVDSTTARQAAAPSYSRGLAHRRQGRDEAILIDVRGHQHAWCESQNQRAIEDRDHGAARVSSPRGASAPRRGTRVAN